MPEFTQAALDDLIVCRKTIVVPPKRSMSSVNGSKRNDMKVQSVDGRQFGVFMRISEAFQEDFSVGLRYEIPDGGGIILLRCNGPHGDVLDAIDAVPHWGFHIHRALEHNICEGRRAEAGASLTSEFASYEQALRYFLKRTNIKWNDADFPGLGQLEMFQ